MKATKEQLIIVVTIATLIVATCFVSGLAAHAGERDSSTLAATLAGMRVLDAIKDRNDLPKGKKYLSLKMRLACAGKAPLAFPVNSIVLKTQKGERCELIGVGNGANEFDRFNVYLPFSAPWYPFSMVYASDDGKKLFGMKQKGKSDLPEISLLARDQVMLIGFVVPANAASFTLSVGPARNIKVTLKAAK